MEMNNTTQLYYYNENSIVPSTTHSYNELYTPRPCFINNNENKYQ